MSEYLEQLAADRLDEGRRAFALACATEVAGDGAPAEAVVGVAEIFERYLRGKHANLRIVPLRHDPP